MGIKPRGVRIATSVETPKPTPLPRGCWWATLEAGWS